MLSYNIIKKENTKDDIEHIVMPETEYIPKEKYDLSKVVEKVEEDGNYDIELIKKEAQEIALKEIELQRKKIIEEAKLEIEKIKEETKKLSYEEGFNKGYEDGFNKNNNEYKKLKENLVKKFTQADEYVENYFKENEKNIINMAINMAENIVNYSLDSEKENIIKLITPILREYDKYCNIVISASSTKIKILEEYKDEIESKSPGSKIVLIEDETLNHNDIILETDYQIIDMGIRKQLEKMIEKIEYME